MNHRSSIFGALLLWCTVTYTGPHKITIDGDMILKENTTATYRVTVKNTSKKSFENLVISVDGFSKQGLHLCEAISDTMKTVFFGEDSKAGIDAFQDLLLPNKKASFTLTVKAARLDAVGDILSQLVYVKAHGTNFRSGRIKKEITIYKV